MKLVRFLGGVAIYAATSSLLVSCQKDETITPVIPQVENNAGRSGVVADDPERVAKVPMIISAGFFLNPSANEVVFDAKGKPDNTPPNVSITAPSAASTVSGNVQVKANASDNVAVTLVSLSVDGSAVTTTTSAPYTLSWNSASLPNGTHTLTVTAKDASGNTKSTSIQVNGSNAPGGDVINPTVSITSPSNGVSVSGTVNITANAGDNVGVSSVSYSVDGTVIGTDNSSPYSLTWNTSNVASGVHSIMARATDAAGNSASSSIQVTVNTTVLPPTSIPSSFQLITPPVGQQGGEWSCVTFAVAYAARSIEQFYKTNASSYSFDQNIFSPEYVYNQIKFSADCGSGAAIIPALDLIKNQGVATFQSMPYTDGNGCSTQPNASQIGNASAFKISSYVTIPNTDQVAIKTMLASNHPVITTLIMDNSFVNAVPGFTWRTYSGSGSLPHTVILCGYDDSRNAYKVMNSYGTTWGDAGFSWIDYDFFPQKSTYNTYAIQ